jgi:ribosomal protein S18 acetylase RimI-like enzyme
MSRISDIAGLHPSPPARMGWVELGIGAEVRLYRRADLDALEWFGSFRGHRRIIQDAYHRQLRDENWMLVADVRGFPVGQLWVDMARKRDVGLLWAFRIMPPFMGLGIGSALMMAAEQMLRGRAVPEAEIGVEARNAGALRLYLRAGFHIIGQEENSFETQDGPEPPQTHRFDVLVLRKRLLAATQATG